MSEDSQQSEENRYKPDWAHRAEYIEHKPNWIDGVPHELWELGDVFFPIPNGQKAWGYPHHLDSKRFSPDDEILNAYLEANSNYGIACANSLAVVDIDEIEHVERVKKSLPDTLWQMTGSRTGVHLFFKCEGLSSRIILRVPKPEIHMRAEGIVDISSESFIHIGEVKCDPHGYVVGPGSKHPSGNEYGPLHGDEIATISEEELRNGLSEYIHESNAGTYQVQMERHQAKYQGESKYEFYNLTTDDVVPWLEDGKRVPHPVHGSSSGSNFMKNTSEDVFTCWRHDYGSGPGCALNPQQLLAVMATHRECDMVRRDWNNDPVLHYKAWREAVDEGIVSPKNVPYTVAKGYAVNMDYIGKDEELAGDMYWDTINAVRCIGHEQFLPDS